MSLNIENKFIVLKKTSTIEVQGDERIHFLQGQLTQDICLITKDQAQYAGFCNPKGRLLAFMLCYARNDAIHIQIDTSIEESILKRLKMYLLRSKVSINLLLNAFIKIGFISSKGFENKGIKLPKKYLEITTFENVMIIRLSQNHDRYQIMGEAKAVDSFIALAFSDFELMDEDEWNNKIILDGIPEIYPSTQETFIPQSLNIDLMEGINFKKGCYTGQEIVARTHYLGKVKRRMYRAFIESQVSLVPGDVITNESNEEIGQLVRSSKETNVKTNLLIELRVDQMNETLNIKNYLITLCPEDKKRFS